MRWSPERLRACCRSRIRTPLPLPMTIRLLTLGGLSSVVDGGELEWLASQWLRAAVLVHLTLERVATRDALQATFWPENDGDTAAHRLSQTVYILRRALGDDAIETRGRELRAGPRLEADALDFERAIEAQRWADAMALYRGPFLAGVHLAPTNAYETWVDARRTQYARQFRKASRAVVDARVAEGDVAGAVAAAQAWVAPDPSDDEAQHRLIELLAMAGARTDALRQYETYARLLGADGLEPLDQTRELVATIEQQTAGASFPVIEQPAGPPSRDAGERVEAAETGDRAETAPVDGSSGPATMPALAEASGAQPARRHRSRARVFAAAVMLAVAGIVALVVVMLPSRPEAAPVSALDAPVPLAVLMFHDAAVRSDLGWLANALTRSIIDAFHGTPALDVRPFHAVWPYRDGLTPPHEIARILAVPLLIAGSVDSSRLGDLIDVRVELVDGATGAMLEPFTVSHAAGDELVLIDEVVQRLRLLLGPRIRHELHVRRWSTETNLPAFRLVQQAADLVIEKKAVVEGGDWLRGWDLLRQADALFAEAARQDAAWPEPAIQRGWVARDIAFLAHGTQVGEDSVAAVLGRGLEQAERAVRLSSAAPRALEIRGVLRYASSFLVAVDSAEAAGLMEAARADLEAATNAGNRLPRALSSLSSLHFRRGDLASAAPLAERAFLADAWLEDAQEIANRLFDTRFEAGENDQATRWCDVIGERWPGSREHARCALKLMAWDPSRRPDPAQAWRMVDTAIARTSESYRGSTEAQLHLLAAAVLAKAGEADSARAVVGRVRARAGAAALNLAAPTDGTLVLDEAAVHVKLGDAGTARRILDENASIIPSPERLRRSRRFASLY